MAIIDFQKTFGNSSGNVKGSGKADDRPKAQLWLNIGYESDVIDEDTGKPRFVSTPQGIPLDTQELLSVNSRNREFAAFQAARNNLLEQILEAGKSLGPGEDCILNLSIQLRRINGDQPEISTSENQFVRKLDLLG